VLDDSIANPSKDETRREMSLYDCLELFTKEETLSKNDPWYCSNCKDHKQATKKFDLWKVPPIVVIHLKRFSYRNRVWREKLETFVDFPIDELDLSQYALGPHDQPLKYELFAVSVSIDCAPSLLGNQMN
jgi:ubiquitin C-terminal hydrolase